MQVKVIRVPGGTKTVIIPDGGTVAEALNAADVEVASTEAVKLNAVDADMSAVLKEGDKIVVAKGAKGNK